MPERRIIDVPADRRASSTARRHVADALDAWALTVLTPDAQLVVSELMTNALVHAADGTSHELRIERLADGIRLVVTDGSPSPPVLGEAAPARLGGRGLRIVESLSSSWGYEPRTQGKRVWAELRNAPHDQTDHGAVSR